jgi:quinol monooxygenase YgiN
MTMRIGLITATVALFLMNAANAQTPGGNAPAAANAPAPPTATTFIVRFKIKPGKNADFEKAMAKIQAALGTAEPGNLYYDLYLPAAGSQTYVLIEHYKNPAAVAAHGQDPNTQQMFTDITPLLDGGMAKGISAEPLMLVSSKP